MFFCCNQDTTLSTDAGPASEVFGKEKDENEDEAIYAPEIADPVASAERSPGQTSSPADKETESLEQNQGYSQDVKTITLEGREASLQEIHVADKLPEADKPGIIETKKDRPISRTKGGPVIIILVNPKSGGNAAGALLKLPADGLLVELQGNLKATCFSYPIADSECRGMKHLADEVEASADKEPLRCIVAGGDGTVMWAIEQIFTAGIPIDRVVVGTIPFGTGNDFGNVTGWGVSGPSAGFLQEDNGCKGLYRYVLSWLRADSHPYDIWEVSVKTRPSDKAGFQFIEDKQKKCTEEHIKRHGIKKLPDGELEMSKYMCNYIGFGLDARVGVGFDKLRQKNRILNKAVYAWEGTKKLLFKKKGVIGHIVESLKQVQGDNLSCARDGHDRTTAPDCEVVFSTGEESSGPHLVGNPVSMIFLNIPSIAGGLDIWNWSRRKLGTTSGNKELLKAPQDFGDGRLECLTYRTGVGFYAEQVRAPPISGQGHRICSGAGPLRLSFRDPSDKEYQLGTSHCKGRTYMQVDGEFIIVHEPESAVIKHHATISVLIRSEGGGCCSGSKKSL